jgi:hypothetical protein
MAGDGGGGMDYRGRDRMEGAYTELYAGGSLLVLPSIFPSVNSTFNM